MTPVRTLTRAPRPRHVLAWLALACALACAPAAGPAGAAPPFSEDFEAAGGLSDGNWTTIGSAVLATPGNGGGHGVRFGAKGSGGDLWSIYVAVGGSTNYWLVTDYKQTGAGGYFGIEEYSSTKADLGESWIWGDGWSYPTPAVFNGAGLGFNHYVYKFTTQSATRFIKIKLEDFTGNGSPLGQVIFDNIQVSATAPSALAQAVKWQEIVR